MHNGADAVQAKGGSALLRRSAQQGGQARGIRLEAELLITGLVSDLCQRPKNVRQRLHSEVVVRWQLGANGMDAPSAVQMSTSQLGAGRLILLWRHAVAAPTRLQPL